MESWGVFCASCCIKCGLSVTLLGFDLMVRDAAEPSFFCTFVVFLAGLWKAENAPRCFLLIGSSSPSSSQVRLDTGTAFVNSSPIFFKLWQYFEGSYFVIFTFMFILYMKDREDSSRFTHNPVLGPGTSVPDTVFTWKSSIFVFSNKLVWWRHFNRCEDFRENPSEFPSGGWSGGLQSSPGRDRWCELTRTWCVWVTVGSACLMTQSLSFLVYLTGE